MHLMLIFRYFNKFSTHLFALARKRCSKYSQNLCQCDVHHRYDHWCYRLYSLPCLSCLKLYSLFISSSLDLLIHFKLFFFLFLSKNCFFLAVNTKTIFINHQAIIPILGRIKQLKVKIKIIY